MVPLFFLAMVRVPSLELRSLATCLLVFLMGMLRAGLVSGESATTLALHQMMHRPVESMTVIGEVSGEPSVRIRDAEEKEVRFPFRIREIQRGLQWQPAQAEADARWTLPADADVTQLAYGQRWLFHVRVTDYRRRPARGYTPYEVGMRVTGLEVEQRLGFHGNRFYAACLALRQRSADALSLGLSDFPEHAGLLRALLLGYREDLPDEREESFARTGTLHVFAISGLHVGIICSLLVLAVQTLGVSRRSWVLCIAPMLLVYTVTTGLKASAVRACIMAIAYWSSSWLFRKPDAPSALAVAALIIVAVAPAQVLAPGFILSFTVVCSILALFRRLYPMLSRWGAPDPWAESQGGGRIDEIWHKSRRYVAGLSAMSVAAWVGSMPLTATYFNLCSPIALPANLIVIPGTFAVVFTGCLSLLSASFSPWLCEVFNYANVALVSLLLGCIDGLRRIPGAYDFVQSPPVLWTVSWYGLLAVGAFAECRRWVLGSALGMLVLFLVLWRGVMVETPDLVCVDTYGSVSMVVRDQPEHTMVLCSELRPYTVSRLIRSLRKMGILDVQQLVISRVEDRTPDALSMLSSSIDVEEVWVAPTSRDDPETLEKLLQVVDGVDARLEFVAADDHGTLPGGIEWEVLYPQPVPSLVQNATVGLIFRIGVADQACLFMGTGGSRAEDVALMQNSRLGCQTLVCGFSVDRQGLSSRWLKAVGCNQVLVSRPRFRAVRGQYGDTLERLHEVGIVVTVTDSDRFTRLLEPSHTFLLQ